MKEKYIEQYKLKVRKRPNKIVSITYNPFFRTKRPIEEDCQQRSKRGACERIGRLDPMHANQPRLLGRANGKTKHLAQ